MAGAGIQQHQLLVGDVAAIQLGVAFQHIQGALRGFGGDIELGLGLQVHRHVEGLGEYAHR